MGAKIPPGKTGALRRAELEAKPPPILVVALAAPAAPAPPKLKFEIKKNF